MVRGMTESGLRLERALQGARRRAVRRCRSGGGYLHCARHSWPGSARPGPDAHKERRERPRAYIPLRPSCLQTTSDDGHQSLYSRTALKHFTY